MIIMQYFYLKFLTVGHIGQVTPLYSPEMLKSRMLWFLPEIEYLLTW